MAGGVHEYMAAYVSNGHSFLSMYGSSLINSDIKYKDVYVSNGDTQSGNYTANSTKKGDAIYETSSSYINYTSWYNNTSKMPYSSSVFVSRSGYVGYTGSGLFDFQGYYGAAVQQFGFRPVVIVSDML
jgi:hypothetical protein